MFEQGAVDVSFSNRVHIIYIYIFITYVSNGSIITIYEPIYVVFVCCIHENHVIKTWTSDFFVQGSGLLH